MIKLIVAVDSNYGIGYDNKLLFNIPEDMKRFKELTTRHYVVMGRKTFESLPSALPNRANIVLTRETNYMPSGDKLVLTSHDIESLVSTYRNNSISNLLDMWVIGGSEIYKEFLPHADEVYVTHVRKSAEKVDTYFPFAELIKEGFYTNRIESFYSKSEGCMCSFAIYRKS